MIRQDFIDFLTSKKTLNLFKTTENGRKFRKATPNQVAAVILTILKTKQDGKFFYGDTVSRVLTHRIIEKYLKKYTETDIILNKKELNITSDTIYSILKSFRFFNPNKTIDKYILIKGFYYIDNDNIKAKKFNNWRIDEKALCNFIGWDGGIYEEDDEVTEPNTQIINNLTIVNINSNNTNSNIETETTIQKITDEEFNEKWEEILQNLSNTNLDTLKEWLKYLEDALKNNLSRINNERAENGIKSFRKELQYNNQKNQ